MDERLCASIFSHSPDPADTFQYERALMAAGYPRVAGVDEAGRGPLAGPVVAGCVILPPDCDYSLFRDSKVLTPDTRQELYDYLATCGASVGCCAVEPVEIDRINILQASLQAMAGAVIEVASQLESGPDFLLVDGKFTAPLALPQQALIKGDSRSASIAAASIVAKVVRDRIMEEYHQAYPEYDFARNKGYPTREHKKAIREYGPCPIHRRTFRGVREYVDECEVSSRGQQPLW
ncbi:MAG: ribonuclease HII [Desulfobulbaceae bacterium]